MRGCQRREEEGTYKKRKRVRRYLGDNYKEDARKEHEHGDEQLDSHGVFEVDGLVNVGEQPDVEAQIEAVQRAEHQNGSPGEG